MQNRPPRCYQLNEQTSQPLQRFDDTYQNHVNSVFTPQQCRNIRQPVLLTNYTINIDNLTIIDGQPESVQQSFRQQQVQNQQTFQNTQAFIQNSNRVISDQIESKLLTKLRQTIDFDNINQSQQQQSEQLLKEQYLALQQQLSDQEEAQRQKRSLENQILEQKIKTLERQQTELVSQLELNRQQHQQQYLQQQQIFSQNLQNMMTQFLGICQQQQTSNFAPAQQTQPQSTIQSSASDQQKFLQQQQDMELQRLKMQQEFELQQQQMQLQIQQQQKQQAEKQKQIEVQQREFEEKKRTELERMKLENEQKLILQKQQQDQILQRQQSEFAEKQRAQEQELKKRQQKQEEEARLQRESQLQQQKVQSGDKQQLQGYDLSQKKTPSPEEDSEMAQLKKQLEDIQKQKQEEEEMMRLLEEEDTKRVQEMEAKQKEWEKQQQAENEQQQLELEVSRNRREQEKLEYEKLHQSIEFEVSDAKPIVDEQEYDVLSRSLGELKEMNRSSHEILFNAQQAALQQYSRLSNNSGSMITKQSPDLDAPKVTLGQNQIVQDSDDSDLELKDDTPAVKMSQFDNINQKDDDLDGFEINFEEQVEQAKPPKRQGSLFITAEPDNADLDDFEVELDNSDSLKPSSKENSVEHQQPKDDLEELFGGTAPAPPIKPVINQDDDFNWDEDVQPKAPQVQKAPTKYFDDLDFDTPKLKPANKPKDNFDEFDSLVIDDKQVVPTNPPQKIEQKTTQSIVGKITNIKKNIDNVDWDKQSSGFSSSSSKEKEIKPVAKPVHKKKSLKKKANSSKVQDIDAFGESTATIMNTVVKRPPAKFILDDMDDDLNDFE